MLKYLYLALFLHFVLFSCSHKKQKENKRIVQPLTEEIRGVDLSHHQGDIIWKNVSKDHVHFVILKATEGGTWLDDKFKKNWEGARKAGFVTGAYHVFCNSDGQRQAKFFSSIVPKNRGSLIPCVDLESRKDMLRRMGNSLIMELKAYNAYIKKKWGVLPIVYVDKEMLELLDFKKNFKNPIWIRHHKTSDPQSIIHLPYAFWQYNISKHKVFKAFLDRGMGIDLDRFNGTRENFLQYLVK